MAPKKHAQEARPRSTPKKHAQEARPRSTPKKHKGLLEELKNEVLANVSGARAVDAEQAPAQDNPIPVKGALPPKAARAGAG